MQLKPCPFCGGVAEMHSARSWGREGRIWTVSCRDCSAQFEDWCGFEEKAAEKWNTRHYDRCAICGRIKEGLLCRNQVYNFPERDLIHVD